MTLNVRITHDKTRQLFFYSEFVHVVVVVVVVVTRRQVK